MRATPWLFLSLGLILLGCSSASGQSTTMGNPAMTGIAFPATVGIGSDGNYDLVGTVSFTDSESLVTEIDVASQAISYSHQIGIAGTNAVNKGMITVPFPANVASGTQIDYEIAVTDEAGTTSGALSGTVTLE